MCSQERGAAAPVGRGLCKDTKCEAARRDWPGQAGESDWKVRFVGGGGGGSEGSWSGQEGGRRRVKGQQF